ncbi:MAG: biotin transporter BioY [Deltaproteobacteria bacterium]|nr:biotin transporter BioY [Deltaproteobacteria bacterium]
MNAASMTLADAVLPQGKLLRDTLLVAGFSGLIAVASQAAVPLPFSPVPLTLQTLAVLLAGMVLGWKRGALAVAAYLGEGFAGLPVFAGGSFGMVHLFGPTGGYLVGFVLAAALVGFLAERRWDRRPATTVLAMAFGTLTIHLCGVAWLSVFVPFSAAIAQGLLPFLVGDALKIGAATATLPLAWSRLGRAQGR